MKQVVWKDESVKRRSIKTRGDASGGLGWRARKARSGHATHADESETQHAFAAPTEPLVRDIVGARDHHRGRPRAQDVGQGRRGHQGADEARHHGHDQPGARPGHGDDRGRGVGARGKTRQARRARRLPCRRRGRAIGTQAGGPAAGGHGDGTRRPRQDVAARLHSAHPGSERRGGRDHAAHRRVSRGNAEGDGHFPRYAGSRGVHGDASARRKADGHRDSGRSSG